MMGEARYAQIIHQTLNAEEFVSIIEIISLYE